MNLKSKIATIATASFLALGIVSGTVAQTATIGQEITANNAGPLTASLGSAQMEAKTFSFDAQKSTGNLVLNVEDGRGTNTGWTVTVNAQDFQPQNGLNATAIPSSGFRFVERTSLTAAPGDANQLQAGNSSQSMTNFTILSARNGTGTGKFTMNFKTELAIPAAQPAGLYQSQVTVQIAAAPGQ